VRGARGLTAVLLASPVLALGPAVPAGAAPGAGFQNYLVGAMAPVYQMTEDAPNATFHPQGEGEFVYSLATMSKATAYALSALAWPGGAAANAGTLASVLGVPGQTSVLNDPARAEATSGTPQTSQTLGGPAGAEMTASVVPTHPGQQVAVARTSSGGTDLGAQGLTGASSSSGRIVLDPATGALTATAEGAASGLQLDGGLVSIGSFSSEARAVSVDGGTVSTSGATVVSDMEVAGHPAYLDGSGVHLGRPGRPAPPAEQSAVDAALRSAGMSIYFTDPHRVPIGGVQYFVAGSVLFYWPAPHDPNGDSFTLTLGGSSVSMGVTAGSPSAASPVASLPPPAPLAPTLSLPTGSAHLNLPSDSVGAGISADIGQVAALRTTAARSGPELPIGEGPWWLVILLAAVASALTLPRLAGWIGGGTGARCPLERWEERE